MHCKSLWIKASAKCINVNVRWSFIFSIIRKAPQNLFAKKKKISISVHCNTDNLTVFYRSVMVYGLFQQILFELLHKQRLMTLVCHLVEEWHQLTLNNTTSLALQMPHILKLLYYIYCILQSGRTDRSMIQIPQKGFCSFGKEEK